MSTIIGLKELRENTEKIIERANSGETFVVVRRSKPVLELKGAPAGNELPTVENWTHDFVNRYRPAFEELAKQ